MKLIGETIRLAATDLSNHLVCEHLTSLDLQVSLGERPVPPIAAPHLVVVQQRGLEHEKAYVEHLLNQNLSIVDLREQSGDISAVEDTQRAMRAGIQVIIQAALQTGRWFGRPDLLRRVETPSDLGSWSYEPYDCKLARATKAATILQLSHYAALLADAQGRETEYIHVVPPAMDFAVETYRVLDYTAYYRAARKRLEEAIRRRPGTYPEPTEHCDVCRWWSNCDGQWRRDDHLSLTAGISRLQRKQLIEWDVPTVDSLAGMPIPLTRAPLHGSKDGYVRVREQARVQVAGRRAKTPIHELLPVEEGRGLCRLPEPSNGDIFFDLESDPFVGMHGREYLFGFTFTDGAYDRRWAISAEEEKAAFEWFVDLVMQRWQQHPTMHVYHFSPKEPSAIKALMGRYATRETEIDRWLRAGLFVDIHSILKQSVRASVEQYSLKDLEAFHGFKRGLPLEKARVAMRQIEHALELGRTGNIDDDIRELVETYNGDDCRSTQSLRDWLEQLRTEECKRGTNLPRPTVQEDAAPENVAERQARVNEVVAALQSVMPSGEADRTAEHSARWLLSNLIDWHRREDKVAYWEKYRLRELGDAELEEERSALSGLTLAREIPPEGRKRLPLHEYSFPPQETKLREGSRVYYRDTQIGQVEYIDPVAGILGIRKTTKCISIHPPVVYTYEIVGSDDLANSLLRIGESVAANGFTETDPYGVAFDLLLRRSPRLKTGSVLLNPEESVVEAAKRLVAELDGTVLPIQGPPGSGKTFTAARMILAALDRGKRVGVTANSHKVIRNLLNDVQTAAQKIGRKPVSCTHKVTDRSDELPDWLNEETNNERALEAIRTRSCEVLAGTAWLWSREDAVGAVDILFVDEAGQMSLANAVAIAPAATNLVLLGDPQQLDQPLQGSHPAGAEVSALEHILKGEKTIRPGEGLFLDETWRLHPSICTFTSEVFYEGLLQSRLGLENQKIEGHPWLGESGLRYVPVKHDGNQNSSPEEVESIARLVAELLVPEVHWIIDENNRRRLLADDILIVAPYNAQVAALSRRLPGMRVGTVDKFQGQQAPVVIYSLTTSTPADAPRGMEFLYSLNRLNVAISRAKAMAILVANRKLLEPECKTPRQLQLANALCRYIELTGAREEIAAGS